MVGRLKAGHSDPIDSRVARVGHNGNGDRHLGEKMEDTQQMIYAPARCTLSAVAGEPGHNKEGNMFAIGNDELGKLPEIGKTYLCPHCGKRHRVRVQYNETQVNGEWVPATILAYVKCGKKLYLVGINGKELKWDSDSLK